MLDSNPFDGSLTAPNTTRARVRRISLSGALSLSMLLYLAACGGGGGDSTAPVGGGGPTLTSNGTVGAAPDYEGVQLKTVMAVNVVTPLASPRSTDYHKSYFGQYGYPRSWVVVDLNGDGLDDRVVAPTVFDQKPDLSVEIWINKGDGTVENRTST